MQTDCYVVFSKKMYVLFCSTALLWQKEATDKLVKVIMREQNKYHNWHWHLCNPVISHLEALLTQSLLKVDWLNYHHLQKFKTNFQNPTTQWKKQSWKYLLFKNIYFQQITILYHTLPPLWYEMVTVSYLVCPQLFLMYFKLLKYPQIPRWS